MTLLKEIRETLPSHWYYDPAHYAAELDAVWYQDWICVGRLEDIARPGDYTVVTIGNQRLIVTKNGEGLPKVFHNTCRHRGAMLCSAASGHFSNGRIICPYHTWTYSLDGDLLATPTRIDSSGFETSEYSLYSVHADSWGGFLYVNLAADPRQPLQEFLGAEANELANWPLGKMVSVHQERASLQCNWKVFWENYSECYHCPRLHPELCKVVPVYRKGILNSLDDGDWRPDYEGDDGRPRVAKGLHTWTLDGQTKLPPIEGLSDTEREQGMAFASFTASMFVVAHPDYVRSVRLLPTGPESIDLIIDWLLMPEVSESHKNEIDKMIELGRLVVAQDGRICEINQQGLRSLRHSHGVLVAQEQSLWEFHEWLRKRLGTT
jgi:Rieske 2Fe-2S family protein